MSKRSMATVNAEQISATTFLAEYFRRARTGQTVSWADMEHMISASPKMLWKPARRLVAKEGIYFEVVDGVGLRRTNGRMINRAVKVEFDVRAMSAHKRQELYQNAGYQRFVRNWAIDQHRDNGWPIGGKAGKADRVAAMERKKKGGNVDLPKKLTLAEVSRRWTRHANNTPELAWTKDRIGSVCRFAIAAVDDAYKHAQRRSSQGEKSGWPKYHGKGAPRQFTLQDQSFRWTRNAIKLGKLGMIPIRRRRVTAKSSHPHQLCVLEGARVLRLAVEEKAERWWCSIMYEKVDESPTPPQTGKTAGVDLGYSITVSDGSEAPPVYDPPRALERHLLWLRHWGKAMSRRYVKGKKVCEQSQCWWKAKRVVQELHLRVAQIRRDWVEQVSDDLTKRYDVIEIEAFDVRKMVSEKVGYRKGRRTILDCGWGMLRSAIRRKAEARDKVCEIREKLDATDQTCSRCGARDERVDGVFRCPNGLCGHTDTRPRNTADLLYRVAIGDPPEGFPGEDPGYPAGEAGVKARGASQDSPRRSHGHSSRSSGNEIRYTQRRTGGGGAKSTPANSSSARRAKSSSLRENGDATVVSTKGHKKAAGGKKRRKARKSRRELPETPRADARDANPRDLAEAAE